MYQAINSKPSEEANRRAIQIISDFGETDFDVLSFTKSTLHHILKEDELSWDSFKVFLEINKKINQENLYNIIQHFNLLARDGIKGLPEKINYVLTNNEFSRQEYKDLFIVFGKVACGIEFDDFDIENKLDEICNLIVEDTSLRGLVGLILIKGEYFLKAKNYLEKYIDVDVPNMLLPIYCEALFWSKSDLPKLLKILGNWRKKFHPHFSLLKMELNIKATQNNWNDLYEISKVGIQHFPKDEIFLWNYFFTLNYFSKVKEMEDSLHLLKDFQFEDETHGVKIAAALRASGLLQESLDLIYSLAKEKENINARQAYFSLTTVYPKGFFQEFEKVEIGTFVKIQLKDKIEIILIKKSYKKSPIADATLWKSKGDTFQLPLPMSSKTVEGVILRIMDKYLALFEEIILDSDNPLLGMPIRKIEFPANFSLEQFHKILQEEFGEEEENRGNQIKNHIEDFCDGRISFSEITAKVFDRKSIEAYQHATSSEFRCFRVLASVLAINSPFNHDTKFILDATSLCLFYDLSQSHSILFDHKFVISAFLKQELEAIIDETQLTPPSKISINITTDGVVPNFYPDDFKERRLDFFKGMLEWVNTHCEVDYVDEKLEAVLKVNEKKPVDGFLKSLIDNWSLVLRENYVLLSSDLYYFKQFGTARDKIINPEIYLESFRPEKTKEFSTYFLEKKYIGIKVRNEILWDEFLKLLTNKENRFSLSLQNLHYKWNPSNDNIDQAVLFLKKVFLSNFINPDTKNRVAFATLSNLIIGMPPQIMMYLKNKIQEEFKVMGDLGLEVLNILIYILNSNTKG